MNTPDVCPNHKVVLIKRPIERQTYEQRWCGEWHDCPQCHYSILYQSAALIAQLKAMTTPLKEQICEATDRLNECRAAFYCQGATYDDVAATARVVLELRQQAEKAFLGKVKTKIDPRSIASLVRSS
jgi:hypothetical protein